MVCIQAGGATPGLRPPEDRPTGGPGGALILRGWARRGMLAAVQRAPTQAALLVALAGGCGGPGRGSPGAEQDAAKDMARVTASADLSARLTAGLAAAAAAGKRVLVEVGASWCPPCHELERTLASAEVAAALAGGYVTVTIDAEVGEGPEVVARYEVRSYPTVLVLDADGAELGRVVEVVEAEALLRALAAIDGGAADRAGGGS